MAPQKRKDDRKIRGAAALRLITLIVYM